MRVDLCMRLSNLGVSEVVRGPYLVSGGCRLLGPGFHAVRLQIADRLLKQREWSVRLNLLREVDPVAENLPVRVLHLLIPLLQHCIATGLALTPFASAIVSSSLVQDLSL